VRRDVRPIKVNPSTVHSIRQDILDKSVTSVEDNNKNVSWKINLPVNLRLNEPGIKYIENIELNPSATVKSSDDVNTEEEVEIDLGTIDAAGINVVATSNEVLPSNTTRKPQHNDSAEILTTADEQTAVIVAPTDTEMKLTEPTSNTNVPVVEEQLISSGNKDNDAKYEDDCQDDCEDDVLRRSTRKRSKNPRYVNNTINILATLVGNDTVFDKFPFVSHADDNPTLGKAMKSPDWNTRWLPAINRELATLHEMGTGTPVLYSDIPPGAEVYPTKFVLTTKRNTETSCFISPKARLVAIGNAFADVLKTCFAPTTHEKSLKLLFALATTLELVLCSIDITGAFLYAEQKRDVYVMLPVQFTGEPQQFWKLNKTLYGLRESPQAFYDDISTFLLSNGYVRTTSDPCMFYKRDSSTEFIMLVVHVDDFAIAASSTVMKEQFLSLIGSKYKYKECSTVESFLGIHVDYAPDGSVLFSQPGRIDDIIRAYNLQSV
jgi:hypothetical protein